jgi:hypothetical protein
VAWHPHDAVSTLVWMPRCRVSFAPRGIHITWIGYRINVDAVSGKYHVTWMRHADTT